MALFSSTPQRPLLPAEDHGDALAVELEDFLQGHSERVANRKSVVSARLAALEAEHGVLDAQERKHQAIRNA